LINPGSMPLRPIMTRAITVERLKSCSDTVFLKNPDGYSISVSKTGWTCIQQRVISSVVVAVAGHLPQDTMRNGYFTAEKKWPR